MATFMQRFQPQTYALMRIMVGFLVLWHGTEKLFDFPVVANLAPRYMLNIGGSIDLVCGVLIMVGLFTGWAAFVGCGFKALTYWMFHGTQAVLPIQNGGEKAALYCFIFLFISSHGSGIWSLDAFLRRGNRRSLGGKEPFHASR